MHQLHDNYTHAHSTTSSASGYEPSPSSGFIGSVYVCVLCGNKGAREEKTESKADKK